MRSLLNSKTMKEKLIDTLNKVGKPAKLYQSPDGTDVLLLPYGGRVLGLFAADSEENFYWTHNALENTTTAKEFYTGEQWHNSGGDRTWLAPEADVFFPNFPKLDKYFQQRQLDPGNYQVVKNEGKLQLVNQLTITMSRSKQEVPMVITKSIGPAPNPLRYERGIISMDDLEYAGYTQFTSLELTGENPLNAGPVGLWNLVQMPHEGDMLIPTYSRTEPRLIMGSISPEELIVNKNLVRYKMFAKGEHKLSIRAVVITGRIGYIYQTGKKWALIIRNFFSNPSGEYVDVPWDNTDYFGFSVQACNVKSGLGSFSELEYHIPAIGKDTGQIRCDDAAQIWAFRGALADILSVVRLLLTIEL